MLSVNGIERPDSDFFLAQFVIVAQGQAVEAAKMVLKYNRIRRDFDYNTATALGSDALGFCNELNPIFFQACKQKVEARVNVLCGAPMPHSAVQMWCASAGVHALNCIELNCLGDWHTSSPTTMRLLRRTGRSSRGTYCWG